jgi:hypothetical protein
LALSEEIIRGFRWLSLDVFPDRRWDEKAQSMIEVCSFRSINALTGAKRRLALKKE